MRKTRVGAHFIVAAFMLAVAAPVAWSAYFGEEPEFLQGLDASGLRLQDTAPIAAIPDIMGEGIFRSIEYLYDISFSPDGSWIAFVLDAIPDKGRMHRYYVYLVRRDGTQRSMTLMTKIGPALSRSFAWSGSGTPVICSPDYDFDMDRHPDKPAVTGASIHIKGTDPVLSPSGRQVVFRQGDEYEASLWVADVEGDGPPRLVADKASPYGELHWSADDQRIAYLAPCSAMEGDSLWSVVPGETPQELLPEPLLRYEWSPAGPGIAVISDAGELSLIEPEGEGQIIARNVRDFTWAPTGKRIGYIASPPDQPAESAYVWDAHADESWRAFESRNPEGWDFSTLRFSPDGNRVYTRGAAGRDVSGDGKYFDRSDRVLLGATVGPSFEPMEAPILGSVQQPAMCDGGRLMIVTVEHAGASNLWCVDTGTGRAVDLGALPVHKYAYSLTWSHDGQALAFEDEGSLMLTRFAR